MRYLLNRRVLAWTAFVLMLGGIAWALDAWLPPEPRWSARGRFVDGRLLPDGSAFAYWDSPVPDRRGLTPFEDMTPLEKEWLEQNPWVLPDGALVLRDIRTGDRIARFFEHRGGLLRWSLSRNGRFIAAALGPGTVGIADLHTGKEWEAVDCPPTHREPVFLGDGERFVVQARNGTAYLVHTDTGRVSRPWFWSHWQFHAASLDGKRIAFGAPNRNVNGERIETVYIWDLDREKTVAEIEYSEHIKASTNSNVVLLQQRTEGPPLLYRIVAWDLASARPCAEITTTPSRVWGVTPGRNGQRLAVMTGPIDIIDHADGCWSSITFCDVPSMCAFAGTPLSPNDTVLGAFFSPDGDSFAIQCRKAVAVLDSATGKELWRDSVRALCFSCDSQALLVRSPDNVEWRDARTGDLLHRRVANGQLGVPATGAWNADRILTYEGPADAPPATWLEELLHRWLPAHREQLRQMPARVCVLSARTRTMLFQNAELRMTSAILSDDGHTLFTIQGVDNGGQILRCWDVPARKPVRRVLGVPLGLGAIVLLTRMAWWRWPRRPTVPQGAAPCS